MGATSPSLRTPARILRERAEALARSVEETAQGGSIQVVGFQLARESYAVEASFVREICALRSLAPVPCAPPFVLGLISLRGEIFPVLDLRKLFGMPEQGLTNAARALILRDARREIGIVADTVSGVRAIGAGAIAPAPAILGGLSAQFLRGIAADGTVVLDAAAVLAHPSLTVREQVPD